MIKLNAKRRDAALIKAAALRAAQLVTDYGGIYSLLDAEMDITAVHLNGCALDLSRFIAFDDTNFGHDALGIRAHIDRDTGKLKSCFLPRCAAAQ